MTLWRGICVQEIAQFHQEDQLISWIFHWRAHYFNSESGTTEFPQRLLYPMSVVWRFINVLVNVFLRELSELSAQLSNFEAASNEHWQVCPFPYLQYKWLVEKSWQGTPSCLKIPFNNYTLKSTRFMWTAQSKNKTSGEFPELSRRHVLQNPG